ncbi:glycoside hydrolase family 35 protein [Punctularia strigosozonata HHB-11173 SS5]|uniref:glycoside hydrolase family 35 protein n=1 Tax=Punctularia strigosozonata (strain HHB-11173) TaxID=741275 RepID=UPI0004416D02|nr:glycoside hydrolase family 35 protein [Punctularia strigosozonata HHB-11173 SS5]EIN12800.1 glycoside hydrolase family 35 protein [Punctularia strigosozonata HHB-11173 SS5]
MPAPHDITHQVRWDNYSLILRGQRVFLNSGEFHPFRLPVPGLWPDILQKFKAAGFNAVSIYTHMGLINPAPHVIDMDGWRSVEAFYDAAKDAGLWVVLRPGPYINAETTAGGFAHWLTAEVSGTLRTNASDFHAAWQDYIEAIINVTIPYQITRGGPVIAIQIDNEYSQYDYGEEGAQYFAQLEDAYRASDIVVPLTYNDPGQYKNFVNGTGAADIYGLDAYPQRFDCSNPERWNPVTTNYRHYHLDTNPSQPFYSPEFQAGAFDAWGPEAPGYEACRKLTNSDFESVFYHSLWAANAKLINYYMVYGGTSWGALPFPGVYTSYDYGAAIAEDRHLTEKYAELKRQGLFLRSSPEFYKTEWVGNSTDGAVAITDPAVFAVLLRNPDTNTKFYFLRHSNSSSLLKTNFGLDVDTSIGQLHLPRLSDSLSVIGRQSKIVVTDYHFGTSTLLYSTAQVYFAGRIGDRDVLFLYGDVRQDHEAAIDLTGVYNPIQRHPRVSMMRTDLDGSSRTLISFLSGIEGLVTIWDSSTQLVLYSDSTTAGTFWSPPIAYDNNSFSNYWSFGTNVTVLVGGPYLVRDARIRGRELALRGDLDKDARLIVIAQPEITTVSWNDILVPFSSAAQEISATGMFVGDLVYSSGHESVSPVVLPPLTGWSFAWSLPEIYRNFSDSRWTAANHTQTNNPWGPEYGDGTVLYGCDYGFCENIVLWRGHFTADEARSLNLSINGGEGECFSHNTSVGCSYTVQSAFAASVWLNDRFIRTTYGNSTNNKNIIEETDETYVFPRDALRLGEDNVITVVQDNMGLDEASDETPDSSKSPRGIRGFSLSSGNFSSWKVQGKLGGYQDYPDKTRGVLNEGGLYGERQGWHLPGYDTSGWIHRELDEGLPEGEAGIGFFITSFELDIPDYLDAPISFVFDNVEQPYRAYLFVNGWMMGKRVANLGPQYRFPVPEGILNYRGNNTVAVALWAMEQAPLEPSLRLELDGVYEGGFGRISVHNPPYSASRREGAY